MKALLTLSSLASVATSGARFRVPEVEAAPKEIVWDALSELPVPVVVNRGVAKRHAKERARAKAARRARKRGRS